MPQKKKCAPPKGPGARHTLDQSEDLASARGLTIIRLERIAKARAQTIDRVVSERDMLRIQVKRLEADLIEARAVNARQKKTAEEIDHDYLNLCALRQIDARRLHAADAVAMREVDRSIELGERGQF